MTLSGNWLAADLNPTPSYLGMLRSMRSGSRCRPRILLSVLLGLVASCDGELPKPEIQQSTLVAGTPMHGIQGLAWGPDGYLYAGAISAQTISKIDPRTGAVEVVVPAPFGEADDLAVAEDGTLAWTAIVEGELRLKKPGEKAKTIATELPGLNPVAFNSDGRLVAGQLAFKNALLEFDPAATTVPRLITAETDNLNSFEFGSDGRLYGPYWQAGVLVAIDIDSGEIEKIADGLGTPAAVSLDSQGRLITVDYVSGHVRRIDAETGEAELIVTLEPPLDNLAVGPDDTIYVSDTANSGIVAVNPATRATRTIVGGAFSTPGDLRVVTEENREALIVADSTGFRFVDPLSGLVTRPRFNFAAGGSLSIDATDDAIAFGDARTGRVHMIDRATRDVLLNSTGLGNPYGVLILEDGTLLVADYASGTLQQLSGDERTTMAEDLAGPVGISHAGKQAVYVAENSAGNITRVDLADGSKTSVATGLDRPEGVALMRDGRLAVVEAGTSSVFAIDMTSGDKTLIASGLPLNVAVILAPTEVGMPAGIAVGADGALYVSCAGDNSIRKIVIGATEP